MSLNNTTGFKPREWQRQCQGQILADAHDGIRDFLAVACPGSGKTMMALDSARLLLEKKVIDRVVIVAPTTEIINQWIRKAYEVGIVVNRFNPGSASCSLLQGQDGIVTSYQQLGLSGAADAIAKFCGEPGFRTMAIIDEIHHAGDHRTWGLSLKAALLNCSFRLALSGTPFRENGRIPFVRYVMSTEGNAICYPSYNYSYWAAVSHLACRVVRFEMRDSEISWKHKGHSYKEWLSVKMSTELRGPQHEAALSAHGDFMKNLFMDAHEELMRIRSFGGFHAAAGGLVLCANINHANATARMIRDLTDIQPVVIHGQIKANHDELINDFRVGNQPWLVAVQMISEGVDIPRLRVGVYGSLRREATLFFRQVVGRFVRIQGEGGPMERAVMFMPHIPELYEHAKAIEEEIRDIADEDIVVLRNIPTGMGRKKSTVELLDSDYHESDSVQNGKTLSAHEKSKLRTIWDRLPITQRVGTHFEDWALMLRDSFNAAGL